MSRTWARAKLAWGCSVSAACLITASGAMAQTCVNLNQFNINGTPVKIVDGYVVVGGQIATRAIVNPGGQTTQFYNSANQIIGNGMFAGGASSGVGGATTPSVTVTEVSTDQALELIQRHRSQQSTATMISGAASAVPVAAATAVASQSAPVPAPSERRKPRSAKKAGPARRFAAQRKIKRHGPAPAANLAERQETAQPRSPQLARPYSERTIDAYGIPQELRDVLSFGYKDFPVDAALTDGVWAEGYGEYEFHSNLNPGAINNPSRKQYTAGLVSGADHTFTNADFLGGGTLQLGLLGGYNDTRSTFTGAPDGQVTKQSDDGGFVGAYGTYSRDRFALDFLVKGDFYNHNQTAACPAGSQLVNSLGAQVLKELQQGGALKGGLPLFTGPINAAGDIAENNLNVLSNVYYRFDIGDGYWLEPTAGFRYSYTAYGDNAALFGLENGELWRIQGGTRIGTGGIYNGYYWSASLLGLLYDDVSIRGYVTPDTGLASGPSTVDQGKLRAMGQLFGTIADGQGWNYWGLFRGARRRRCFAVGGKLGVRYQW